jgi:Amt family ammonium transporter
MAAEVLPWGDVHRNLPQNSDSAQQQVLDALPVLILLEREGKIVYANDAARTLLAEAEIDWPNQPAEKVFWGLSSCLDESDPPSEGGRRSAHFHATLPARNGRLFAVEGVYSLLDGSRHEAIIVAHPDSIERAPRSGLMEDVLASIPEALAIVYGGRILYTNPAFIRLFGYTSDEAAGGRLLDLIVPETRQSEELQIGKLIEKHGSAVFDTVRAAKDGTLRDVSLHASPLLADGVKAGFVYSFCDIADRKLIEARLQHDALHDTLTGLPNRALFLDRLTQALARQSRRRDQNCGVLYINLDRFKKVNESFGQAAGDALLVAVAERLGTLLRPQDTAARFHGDEFAILVENVVSAADLEIVARRVVEQIAVPFQIYGHTIETSASMGAALASPEHKTAEDLLRDANYVLYLAKQRGGSGYEFFDRRLDFQFSNVQERENELRQLIENRTYEIWYQPFFRIDNGRLAGFESLLRQRRPDGTVQSFRDLLAIAEDTGLSISLGRQTFETVFANAARASATAPPQARLTYTVNLSLRQFYHPELIELVAQSLATAGSDPTLLLLEVSETTLNQHPDTAVGILQRLVDLGVRVAMDNFGSGPAPLTHFLSMPLDVIKLDPRISASAATEGRQRILLDAVLRLARDLGIQVIAQGVETMEQFDALAQSGCEFAQGYLLSEVVDPIRARNLAQTGFWIPPDRQA